MTENDMKAVGMCVGFLEIETSGGLRQIFGIKVRKN
jgi:hypothetical protein